MTKHLKSRLDHLIDEWAASVAEEAKESGFSGINVIEKILRDPGVATGGGKHKVLWWPKNRRIALMSRCMHQIDSISQICLLVEYEHVLKDDGSVYTKHDLAKDSSVRLREFNDRCRSAKNKLRELTRT